MALNECSLPSLSIFGQFPIHASLSCVVFVEQKDLSYW
jgi:hypothetical protein